MGSLPIPTFPSDQPAACYGAPFELAATETPSHRPVRESLAAPRPEPVDPGSPVSISVRVPPQGLYTCTPAQSAMPPYFIAGSPSSPFQLLPPSSLRFHRVIIKGLSFSSRKAVFAFDKAGFTPGSI